jgi:hypothetical protein
MKRQIFLIKSVPKEFSIFEIESKIFLNKILKDSIMNTKIMNRIVLILIVGVLFLIFSPWLFTRDWSHIKFDSSSANIGDTIGGITAPIASLIGSILVFYALKAQIEANKLILQQFEFQKKDEDYKKLSNYLIDQIKLIREDLNESSITITKRTPGQATEIVTYKGIEAFSETLEIFSKGYHAETEQGIIDSHQNLSLLNIILNRINYLLDLAKDVKLKFDDQSYLENLVIYTYESKLRPILKGFSEHRMKNKETCSKCGKKHNGLPEILYEKYDTINEKIQPLIQ